MQEEGGWGSATCSADLREPGGDRLPPSPLWGGTLSGCVEPLLRKAPRALDEEAFPACDPGWANQSPSPGD